MGDIVVVGLYLFAFLEIDLTLHIYEHKLFHSFFTGIGRSSGIGGAEGGLLLYQFGIAGKVRSNDGGIFRPPYPVVFQPQLELGNLVGFDIPDEPIVGISSIVACYKYLNDIVDAVGILCGLPGTYELGCLGGVEAFELGDGSLGDEDAVAGNDEIVSAVDIAGHAVHQHMAAFVGDDVGDDIPMLAYHIRRPVVVAYHDLTILCIAAGDDECAAIAGGFVVPAAWFLFVHQLGDIIISQLFLCIESGDIEAVVIFMLCF